ncbi:hypothetical protein CK203_061908 [Vitis vinifera]|uniref:Uncharacterized protein n=1 Tax=Vitis vinifera TaxID=29760 RepID=A0A438GCH4_VITVI|nr:hypothetical protein CK203_061908 [Vitis vinifera]
MVKHFNDPNAHGTCPYLGQVVSLAFTLATGHYANNDGLRPNAKVELPTHPLKGAPSITEEYFVWWSKKFNIEVLGKTLASNPPTKIPYSNPLIRVLTILVRSIWVRRVLLLVCCEPRGRSDGEVMSDRCWFVVESKSQNLVEAVGGKLQESSWREAEEDEGRKFRMERRANEEEESDTWGWVTLAKKFRSLGFAAPLEGKAGSVSASDKASKSGIGQEEDEKGHLLLLLRRQ